MIVDTSAISAEQGRTALSAASYLETWILVDGPRSPVSSRRLDEFLAEAGIKIVEVTPGQALSGFWEGQRASRAIKLWQRAIILSTPMCGCGLPTGTGAVDRAGPESVKRDRAIELLDGYDLVLSIQVLQEFYVQATRASRTDSLPLCGRGTFDREVVAISDSGDDLSGSQRGAAHSRCACFVLLG